MFRELTRKNKQIRHEECIEILKRQTRGVLSVNGEDGYPYGMPMNHFYNDEDACVYFHCGRTGHRLDALRKCTKASFCTYEEGCRKDGDWALTVRSVVVFGKIEIIDDLEKVITISERLCRKFTQDEQYIRKEIESYAEATLLLRLVPEHICGKIVKEA